MRVIDASLLVGLLLGQPAPVEAVLRATDDEDDPFHCPALVGPETLNALRGMERGRRISREVADRAASEMEDMSMILYPFGGPIRRRAWALRHDLSIYDASYVALAESLAGSVLLTADEGLATIARASLGEARVELVA